MVFPFSRLRAASAVLLCLFAPFSAAGAEDDKPPGYRRIAVSQPDRPATLDVHLWYPATEGGDAVLIADGPVFRGSPARAGAVPAPGRHPLILLSHGLGGNAAALGWIAGALAVRGAIVAAPNHPGSTTGDSVPGATIEVWHRPRDLSAVLTALTQADPLSGHIDPARVGVMGFSLGGYTALAVAGARVSRDAYARYCDLGRSTLRDCGFFRGGGVDLHRIPSKPFEASHADPRVSFALAVDPGLAQAYTPDSLRAITMPVTIVNLGGEGRVPPAIAGDIIAATIPGGRFFRIKDAVHESFLPECTEHGAALLKDDGEAFLCADDGGRDRRAIHRELARRIGDSLAAVGGVER